MRKAITQFEKNINRVKELGSIFSLVESKYPLLTEQGEEILRAQIVLIVSAFDTFIHDCIRTGIIQSYTGLRETGSALNSYNIPFDLLSVLERMPTIDDKVNHLENLLREKNSKDSYQSPRSIEFALGLINIRQIWTKVSPIMSIPAVDVKNKLSLIVERRNRIAHESDYNPVTNSKYPIEKDDVDDVIKFLEKLSKAIFDIL